MKKETIKHLLEVFLNKYGRAYVHYLLGSYTEYLVRNGKLYSRYNGDKHKEVKIGRMDDSNIMEKINLSLLGVSGVSFNKEQQ